MRLSSHKHVILLTAGIIGLSTSFSAGAGIKCWTNDEGVRECGNAVPPEYAQQGHKEISEQGIVVDEKERALTDEEIEARERQAAIEAEKERALEEQRRKDAILLQTFSSEEDIITARDYKISAMEAQIKLAESRIDKLQADLDKRIEQAAVEERAGRKPPEALLEDIDSLRRQIETNKQFITDTRTEQERVRAEYDADLERFRELKQGG